MTGADTMLWAADDGGASRDVLAAIAPALGLTVEHCPSREIVARAANGRPRVVGLEAGADAARALVLVGELHARLPRASIIVASSDGDLAFLQAALEAGASDVLSLPLRPAELHKSVLRALRTAARTAPAPEAIGEVITLCGARGGLGVTTLAVNLATRLAARTGGDVGLADLDLQRGDVAAFLNLAPLHSIADFAATRVHAEEMLLASSLVRHGDGVCVLPAPPDIEEADAIGHAEVKSALDLMRARFRYTIVDTARTITGATVAALETSRRILVVTNLSVPGVRSTRRLLELLAHLGVQAEHVEVVVTEAVPGPVRLAEAARVIGTQPVCVIPRDEAAAGDAMNQGAPLNGKPTRLAVAIDDLAARIAGEAAAPKQRSNQFLRRLFNRSHEVIP